MPYSRPRFLLFLDLRTPRTPQIHETKLCFPVLSFFSNPLHICGPKPPCSRRTAPRLYTYLLIDLRWLFSQIALMARNQSLLVKYVPPPTSPLSFITTYIQYYALQIHKAQNRPRLAFRLYTACTLDTRFRHPYYLTDPSATMHPITLSLRFLF